MSFDVEEVDAGVLAAADDADAAPERHDRAERRLHAVLRVEHFETFLQLQVAFAVYYPVGKVISISKISGAAYNVTGYWASGSKQE